MKKQTLIKMGAAFFAMQSLAVNALDIPGADGSDGALVWTENANRNIDLALADTGTWDQPGTGNGVYDPDRWVVVFKFTEVNISPGNNRALTFSPHPSGAPVMFLVNGDVTISSGDSISVSGVGSSENTIRIGGPGGFAGGIGSNGAELIEGDGYGPGGGVSSLTLGNVAVDPGSHRGNAIGDDDNEVASRTYGNERILPLIGGSGGGAYFGSSGAGGGGAILIAAEGTITIDGSIEANGGDDNNRFAGTGAGGAIRLIAENIGGNGELRALGFFGRDNRTNAGDGYVRLEANSGFGDLLAQPLTNIVAPDDPVLLFPPAGSPEIKVVSIGGLTAPADPLAQVGAGTTDLQLPGNATGTIVVETRNVDLDAEVELYVIPKHGARSTITLDSSMAVGDRDFATWTVNNVTLPQAFFTVQAFAKNAGS